MESQRFAVTVTTAGRGSLLVPVPFNPDEVPPATDDPVPTDITESEQYQEEREEIEREEAEGELKPKPDPFPPTRYDE